MREAGLLTRLALGYFAVLTAELIVLGLVDDALLFQSDGVSLALFFLDVSAILFVPAALLLWLVPRLGPVMEALCLAHVLFGFGIYTFDTFVYRIESPSGFLAFAVAAYLAVAALALRRARRPEVAAVARRVAVGVSLTGLVLVLALNGYNLWTHRAPEGARRNAVLIVMDGMSTRYLSPYVPGADSPGYAAMAADSRLYTRAHTNWAFTAGFFDALYTGHKVRMPNRSNLLALLEGAGVNVRWSTFHNSGVPGINRAPHRGLKSAFLTQNYTWVPRLLGLDYGVFRSPRFGTRGRRMGAREEALYRLLNQPFEDGNLLETHLVSEIEDLHRDGRPFFLLFHTDHAGQVSEVEDDPETEGLWEESDRKGERAARIRAMKKAEYVYGPEDAELVEHLRQEYANGVRAGTESLARFFATFRERGWDRDTLLIVTADHGKMFAHGRIWYSFHPDEEVARVPMLLHYPGLSGTDARLAETIDLTQTLLQFFGVTARLDPNAVSLLDPPTGKLVTTMTHVSDVQHHWFANVYEGENKYVLDVYPRKGSYPYRVERVDGLDEQALEPGTMSLQRRHVEAVMAQMGLRPGGS